NLCEVGPAAGAPLGTFYPFQRFLFFLHLVFISSPLPPSKSQSNIANRLSLVSSCFALSTQCIANLWYVGAWAWKNCHACSRDSNFISRDALSFRILVSCEYSLVFSLSRF